MNNRSSADDGEITASHYFTTDEVIAGSVILVVLILSAVIGNALTCIIICKNPSFRTTTNISILFLSVSDISVAGLVMPLSLASLIDGKWLFSPGTCTFTAFIHQSLLGVSLITMTCTAVIRYLCVVKPALHHQYVKPKTVAKVISLLWLGFLVVHTLASFAPSENAFYDERRVICIYRHRAKVLANTINIIGLAAGIVLGLIMFLAYFKVFRFVAHHNNTVTSNLQPGNSSHIEEAKITKTLVIVVLGFVFCWVPVTIIQLINIILFSQSGQLKIPNFVFLFQTICIFNSSAINPFIYGFTNKKFRKQYFKLLGILCPSSPQVAPDVNRSS